MNQAQLHYVKSSVITHISSDIRRARARAAYTRSRTQGLLRAIAPVSFSYLAGLADVSAIVASAYLSDKLYHVASFGLLPPVESVTSVGVFVALLIVLFAVQRSEYDLRNFLMKSGQFARTFPSWNLAFLFALAFGFATKTTAVFSRGGVGIFYIFGFLSLVLARIALVQLAIVLRRSRMIQPRRVVIVGFEDRLNEIKRSESVQSDDVQVVCLMALRDDERLIGEDLALAAAAVRVHRADEVCVALPWSRHDLIEACADAFLRTPAEIHIGVDAILERFSDARVARLGAIAGLRVTRPPLSRLKQLEKRIFDIVVASSALVALSPLLALVALIIRLESPGPALFRQTRYGFNQEPFMIYKFRTMRSMENGANIVQATRNDPRVTRIGAYLRKYSIDELPQLLNVLKGDMSIVGPRPHALAHDQRYVERLDRYARRHNVKPGITGWAQVHGHRGEIHDDAAMQARLDHDLYYVDNGSLWLDIKIVAMTAFSSKAHRNAY